MLSVIVFCVLFCSHLGAGKAPEDYDYADYTTVKPFDCSGAGAAIQVLKDENNTGFDARKLDVLTGEYKPVYSIPYSRTEPQYNDLNACAMSPVTNLVYCILKWNDPQLKQFLVRVDGEQIEFVAEINKYSITAAFDSYGNFWFGVSKNAYSVKGVDFMVGSSDWTTVPAITHKDLPERPMAFGPNDMVVIKADLEDSGDRDYIIGINSKRQMTVSRVTDGTESEDWLLNVFGNEDASGNYGAGWYFQGRAFFSANSGDGVLEVNIPSIDLAGKQVSVEKVGVSAQTGFNDGINCMLSQPPKEWIPQAWTLAPTTAPTAVPTAAPTASPTAAATMATLTASPTALPTASPTADPNSIEIVTSPWDCTNEGGDAVAPLQMIADGYTGGTVSVKALTVSTGAYRTVFSVQKDWTTPVYITINACGVNPIDSIIYCQVKFGGAFDSYYVARVDTSDIAVVGKLPGTNFFASGTFGDDGTYYVASNLQGVASLYSIHGLDELKGFAGPGDHVEDFSAELPYIIDDSFADLVSVKANLEGTGEQEYLIACKEKSIIVIRVSQNPYQSWTVKAAGIEDSGPHAGFGAGWNFQGNVYFSSNAGKGVFMIDTARLDLSSEDPAAQAVLVGIGDNQASQANDGLNCMYAETPFPEPATPAPTKRPTMQGECLPGFVADKDPKCASCGLVCRKTA